MPAEHISATMRQEIIREIYPNGSRPSPVGDSVTCPICLDTFGVHTVTTNCGHLFDLDCYLSFWEHSGRQTNTQCPCCRQRVSLLFPNFEPSNNREISERIRRYNRLHGGVPRSAMEHITDVPELLRRIFMQLFSGRDGLRLVFAIRIACLFLGLIMYVLSPFDIIPEAAFGLLGYVDDILVVFLLVIYATMIYRQAVINNASSTTAGS